MRTEFSIDQLVADLQPVRRRSAARDAAVLSVVAGAELALWLVAGFARPDFADAIQRPFLWWKLGSLLVLAILGAATALASFTPEISPRRGLGWTAALIGVVLLVGGALGAGVSSFGELAQRIDWHHGLMCLWKMAALSIPPVTVLGLLARRGAPTDPRGTALACGLGAAGWGAFVFAFACPSDDPLYIAAWYLAGCGLVATTARAVVARVARW